VRFAVCFLGAEVFALEFAGDAEVEEFDDEGTRLTTSDHSFGFAEEPSGYWEEEE
jgi:hypothetical protein